jgi:hypothetical protein
MLEKIKEVIETLEYSEPLLKATIYRMITLLTVAAVFLLLGILS